MIFIATISPFPLFAVLGPVRNDTARDGQLDTGNVAPANNGADPARVAGVSRGGLELSGGHCGSHGAQQMPRHLGGVWRRPDGQPTHRVRQRAAVPVARLQVQGPGHVQE